MGEVGILWLKARSEVSKKLAVAFWCLLVFKQSQKKRKKQITVKFTLGYLILWRKISFPRSHKLAFRGAATGSFQEDLGERYRAAFSTSCP